MGSLHCAPWGQEERLGCLAGQLTIVTVDIMTECGAAMSVTDGEITPEANISGQGILSWIHKNELIATPPIPPLICAPREVHLLLKTPDLSLCTREPCVIMQFPNVHQCRVRVPLKTGKMGGEIL